ADDEQFQPGELPFFDIRIIVQQMLAEATDFDQTHTHQHKTKKIAKYRYIGHVMGSKIQIVGFLDTFFLGEFQTVIEQQLMQEVGEERNQINQIAPGERVILINQ